MSYVRDKLSKGKLADEIKEAKMIKEWLKKNKVKKYTLPPEEPVSPYSGTLESTGKPIYGESDRINNSWEAWEREVQ